MTILRSAGRSRVQGRIQNAGMTFGPDSVAPQVNEAAAFFAAQNVVASRT